MNRDDLLTILCIGIHMAKVNNEMATGEKKLLGQLVHGMNLTDEEKSRLVESKTPLSELVGRLNSDESVQMMAKTVCAVAHADGEVDDVEQQSLTKLVESSGVQVEILPSDQWGTYEADVRGAFMYYANR